MGSRLEAKSSAVRKRIEAHTFEDEEGEEYGASKFGGFSEYFRRKKLKLQNLDKERRSHSTEKPQIFRGVVAHVNGYTQPSLNDLHNLIVDHGGGFLQYLDGKTSVTHVIASNLTSKKKVEFRRYRIVKPAWVVDSIKAGKLLPWDSYRVVDEGIKQNILGLQGGSVVSQASTGQAGYRDQTDTSWYTSQVKNLASRLEGRENPDFPFPSTQLPSAVQDKQDLDDGDLEDNLEEIAGQSDNPPVPRLDLKSLHEGSYGKNGNLHNDFGGNTKTGEAEESYPVDGDQILLEHEQGIHKSTGDLVIESHGAESAANKDFAASPNKKPLTAEEHNAALLADPKVRKSTVVNPAFLKQYYEESRLHHLSTWKAELKSQLQALAEEQTSSQRARRKRPPGSRRYILHVDFDCFFAAVSLKSHPEWTDMPAVVAHGGGSGSEIASSNYPARKFGIKNGMWMKSAQQLCPNLKVLPYDFKAYEAASRDFYSAIMDTGGIVQSVSVDEALVDISLICIEAGGSDGKAVSEGSVHREQTKADEIASNLRAKIKEKTGCSVSVGVGGNILLAKVALRKAKPAGQYHVKPEEVLEFIGKLPVQDLPGVAHSIGGKLDEIGVHLIKDVRELSKERLMSTLGPKTGQKIWDYARGVDRTEVGEQVVRKSVSAEVNWGVRFATQDQADEFVQSLCEELHKRLLNEKVKGRQLTLKLMRKAANVPLDPPKHLGHGPCDVFNKSSALGVATNDRDILSREAISMMKGFAFPPGELRGIGVQVTKLEPIRPMSKLQDSSQRPLNFGTSTSKFPENPDDVIESPQKPVKGRIHPAAKLAASHQEIDPKPSLNTLGTQFVLPSQIDPNVLAELPEDIRSKLAPQSGPVQTVDPRQQRLNFKDRSHSPAPDGDPGGPPSEPQLDPETLAALPDDLREEVLTFYHKSPQRANKQAVLPQLPLKNRSVKLGTKKAVTPAEKRGGLLFRGKGRGRLDSKSTLTQSNFVSIRDAGGTDSGEISPEFLAALPEDIRQEVIDQQRQERLKKRGGLDIAARKKAAATPAPPVARVLELSSKPPRPAFTSQKLTQLPELRETISAWVREFKDEEPNEEDVGDLSAYLKRVVVEERDMSKAISVVKWFDWLVGQRPESKRIWAKAVESVKEEIQMAVKQRGLGRVDL